MSRCKYLFHNRYTGSRDDIPNYAEPTYQVIPMSIASHRACISYDWNNFCTFWALYWVLHCISPFKMMIQSENFWDLIRHKSLNISRRNHFFPNRYTGSGDDNRNNMQTAYQIILIIIPVHRACISVNWNFF